MQRPTLTLRGGGHSPLPLRGNAPGMWSARYRPDCTGAQGSSRRWMTRAGAVIVGRIGRTSIWKHRREGCPSHPRARTHALQRSQLAYRPDRRHYTLECRTTAPRRADGAAEFLQAAICSVDGV